MKKYFGIVISGTFYFAFLSLALPAMKFFSGACIYLVNGIQRLLFGLAGLFVFVKFYGYSSWKDVINFKNARRALFAGGGMIFLILHFCLADMLGGASFASLSLPLLITDIFLMQITTGFYEELIYRGFVCEGFFHQENQSRAQLIKYALISFVIFGLLHTYGAPSLKAGLLNFILTGITGFILAVSFLCSHNLLVPMILHFLYDIPANLARYADYADSTRIEIAQLMGNQIFIAVWCFAFAYTIFVVIKYKTKQIPGVYDRKAT